jgi:hypothetical protein
MTTIIIECFSGNACLAGMTDAGKTVLKILKWLAVHLQATASGKKSQQIMNYVEKLDF